MRVRVVRKVITYVEDILSLSPEEYCKLRADNTPLRTSVFGNVDIEVKTFEPLTEVDNQEVFDYTHRDNEINAKKEIIDKLTYIW